MEENGKDGMYRARMKLILGFLVQVRIKYRYMKPYINRLNLTLDSWRNLRDKEGWRMRGEQLKISELDVKREQVE